MCTIFSVSYLVRLLIQPPTHFILQEENLSSIYYIRLHFAVYFFNLKKTGQQSFQTGVCTSVEGLGPQAYSVCDNC